MYSVRVSRIAFSKCFRSWKGGAAKQEEKKVKVKKRKVYKFVYCIIHLVKASMSEEEQRTEFIRVYNDNSLYSDRKRLIWKTKHSG